MRGLALLVRKSLRQHALSSAVTAVSVALATGLLMAVFALNTQTYLAFTGGPAGFDAVLGARGSQLQLVLNTMFHLETSPGNIPWALYAQVRDDPGVELAIPYAVGDNFQGFRVVGTTPELFTRFRYRDGRALRMQPSDPPGRPFEALRREAVVGSYVAQRTGLRVGAVFQASHGVVHDGGPEHDERFTVVGVLEPTNSPTDRVVWIPIEGIFRMGGHVLRGDDDEYRAHGGAAIPERHKEVSAVMLVLKSPQAGVRLDQTFNKQGHAATVAWPISRSLHEFFERMGWLHQVLSLIAALVVLVAAGSILASIYNAMNERRREFAILRALGAGRATVFSAIILEAATIALLGTALGFLVYAALMAAAAHVLREQTGVVLEVTRFHPALLATPVGMTLLGALSGLVPARKAYATDVASNLLPHS